MRKTKYIVKPTTQFKKDFKLAMKRSMKIELLEEVIAMLAMGETLPDKHKDHALTGNWVGHRECHILPDWLLIYRIEDEVLVLTLGVIHKSSTPFSGLYHAVWCGSASAPVGRRGVQYPRTYGFFEARQPRRGYFSVWYNRCPSVF